MSESERTAATEYFHQITEAYRILSKPEEKREHDRVYDGKRIKSVMYFIIIG